MNYWKAFLGFIITFLVLDGIWINVVALDLYKSEIGSLLADQPRMAFAALFYIAYAAACIWLIIKPANNHREVILNGAILGALCYGTFAVTNYAMIEAWTAKLMVLDIFWGGFITAACALVGYLLSRRAK